MFGTFPKAFPNQQLPKGFFPYCNLRSRPWENAFWKIPNTYITALLQHELNIAILFTVKKSAEENKINRSIIKNSLKVQSIFFRHSLLVFFYKQQYVLRAPGV